MDKKGFCFSALRKLVCCQAKSEVRKNGDETVMCYFGGGKHQQKIVAETKEESQETKVEKQSVQPLKASVVVQENKRQTNEPELVPPKLRTSSGENNSSKSKRINKKNEAASYVEAEVSTKENYSSHLGAEGSSYYYDIADENAAIRIQFAFRGFMARRGYMALRSLMRLHSLLQSQSVKRQTKNTMYAMQILVRMHTEIHLSRQRIMEENQTLYRQSQAQPHPKDLNDIEKTSHYDEKQYGNWDSSVLTKEETEARIQTKVEAAIKRERALAYAFSHKLWRNPPKPIQRMLLEMDAENPHWDWSWLEQWMANRPWDKNVGADKVSAPKKLPAVHDTLHSHNIPPKQPKIEYPSSSTLNSGASTPRMKMQNRRRSSFEEGKPNSWSAEKMKHGSHGGMAGTSSVTDTESNVSTSGLPRYMTSTESARAKVRSRSTPKLRPSSHDAEHSKIKNKRLSLPYNELSSGSFRSLRTSPKTHPSHKGVSLPVKSDRSFGV